MNRFLSAFVLTTSCLSGAFAHAQTAEELLKQLPSIADKKPEAEVKISIGEPIEEVVEEVAVDPVFLPDPVSSAEELSEQAGEAIAEAAYSGGEAGVTIETSATNAETPFHKLNVFGFDLSRANINTQLLLNTGKYPWEIPTVLNPDFTDLESVRHHMTDGDYLMLVEVNGSRKAYPLKMMNWHRGINDVIGGKNVFVVWDPFAGNATAFERDMRGRSPLFADSGMMYRSSIVYFDQASRSLWIPSLGHAVTGKMAPNRFKRIPVVLTQYKKLMQEFPDTPVMSFDLPTVEGVDYTKNPLGNYARETRLIYPAYYENNSMARKEPVLGITLHRGGHSIDVAFQLGELLNRQDTGRLEFNFEVGHHPAKPKIPMNLEKGEHFGEFKITSLPEVEIETQYSYWFSWITLHPDSYVITKLP